jgi:hypothetical protein
VGREDYKFFRKEIVGGLGAGLAATVVAPTFADNMARSSISQPLPDPTTKYPMVQRRLEEKLKSRLSRKRHLYRLKR